VLQAVARHRLELAVPEALVAHGAGVLPREARARDALVVGGEGHGDAARHVAGERVLGAAHLEDLVVAAQAHLHQHPALAHRGEEPVGVGLGEHVDAVADALGVAHLHRAADVKGVVRCCTRRAGSAA
jgi:hypothetical protein